MKTFRRFVAFGLTLSIIMCSTAASTFASESTQGRASNTRGNGEVDKEIMWRGYRYSTAIVAGTHCAFLTMRGYNGI